MIELRSYQRAAIEAVYSCFHENAGNPLIVVPTGGGKSPIAATFIKEAIEQWAETRILYLVHVKELIEQSYRTLIRSWPEAPATIYSAGLGHKNLRGQIVFASIQSIFKRGFDLQRVDLVLVDEAHLIPHSGDGMYRRLLTDLAACNPYVKVIGLTATPYRMSSGILTEGEGKIFDAVAYEIGIAELIEQGYLCPPVTKSMATRFDLSQVGTRGGEFIQNQLAGAVDRDECTVSVVKEILSYGQDRKSWLVFGTGVDHAFHLRDELRRHGITAETVTGETPGQERTQIINAYRTGQIRALTNADILTTGFDAPQTDLLAVVRPTRSAGLWVQIVGRGTRTAPGKENCLVLDFGENCARHGPIDQIRGQIKIKGEGQAPVKECPTCHSMLFAAALRCADCGHVFPEPEPVISVTASTGALLSGQSVPPEWFGVRDVVYDRHEKMSSRPTVRVTYQCGLTSHREWVCPEHGGFPRQKFMQWWQKRAPGMPVPNSVDEALQGARALTKPVEIAVRPRGKFTEIVGFKF